MFFKKKSDSERIEKETSLFNVQLNKLIDYKFQLETIMEYHNLFNSLLLKNNEIYCIDSFKLPIITDKYNDCLQVITKNKFYKDWVITTIYHNFHFLSVDDYSKQILKEKDYFRELKLQLNIFGFDIIKLEKLL